MGEAFFPFHYRKDDRRKPSIAIGSAACRIRLMIVFISIFWDEHFCLCLDFLFSTSTVPYEESVSTFYDFIRRVHRRFSIKKKVEIFSTSTSTESSIRISEIRISDSPWEIRKKISPSRSCHMDMNQWSFFIMKMDTILGFYIRCDIASGGFFHIHLRTEIFLFTIDIYSEVRMIVDLVWARSEYIGDCDSNEEKETPENMFFHRIWEYGIFLLFQGVILLFVFFG